MNESGTLGSAETLDDLHLRYSQFIGYWKKLREDASNPRHLLSRMMEKDCDEMIEINFEVFCWIWFQIQMDSVMKERWEKRLDPGGYEAESAGIMAELQRCREPVKKVLQTKGDQEGGEATESPETL